MFYGIMKGGSYEVRYLDDKNRIRRTAKVQGEPTRIIRNVQGVEHEILVVGAAPYDRFLAYIGNAGLLKLQGDVDDLRNGIEIQGRY